MLLYSRLIQQIQADRLARGVNPTNGSPYTVPTPSGPLVPAHTVPSINVGAVSPSTPGTSSQSPLGYDTTQYKSSPVQQSALMPADTGLTTTADVTQGQADNRAKAMQLIFAAGLIAAGLFFVNGGGKNW